MNAQTPLRGGHLVTGGRKLSASGRWIARAFAGSFAKALDGIDRGLDHGSIRATLPDGSIRTLGGRGDGPAARIHLKSWNAIVRLATAGSIGWYEAWVAGEWESPDPVPIFDLFMRNADALGDIGRAKGPWRWGGRLLNLLRRNSKAQARRNIAAHYDLGNDFYSQWLDPTMSYSSAMWEGIAPDASLAEAQANKVDRLGARLDLRPGSRVLEIGCGWGFLARGLAEKSGAQVTGISLSDEQLEWARGELARSGLGGIDYLHRDYRDVEGQYDAIASVEMVEAVGREYWPSYFDCLARCLKPGGRAALQYISMRDELFEAYASSADFIQAYIFPGGLLISEREFARLAAERGLTWQDRTDFGQDYARTLRLWREALDTAVEEGRLPPGFDQRFVDLWRYYLMYCEGGFRGGGINVSQVTLVKAG
ncbi:Cyclopropane-fatty-acyl-phospholipid synthase [Novosphingobium aromaticivorans DSM 12444]|uniref:Cyclopropane-fatty-acyl-phospholipid synthase n=1 Tax=Novosphingobium aromaticivorans (strain ATCC 700278 / DSM 12444 / CCUG 56034 / CIP 105152 / NBRC 16084 / F199) TaxID=279238 RepID=Q2G7H3_NOVAD|nr:cyclopropane-fatty-acyl-phospholipid synthase family protein [Novosphingobium aromaticivorans]ABD26200.1 Cyclopropane-fatty-acyl-phospholipid synthase [Novosphingobium aromaticivorans DSM 12444]SCY57399.1 cyclopropane-fatty-acyl-phospholipid synthase [Novosphingobium aromaticivorans]